MRLHARLLALAITLAGTTHLTAQSGCFDPIGSVLGTGDDVVLPIQSLGFAFPFNGTTYTDIHVCTNGFLYLSNGGVPAPGGSNCCTGTTALLVAGSPMIAPRFDDLNVISGTGAVYFNTLPGKAVITWQNAVEYTNAVTFTMQCELYASGMIEFSYDPNTMQRTTGNALVGFSPGNGATVPAASDLSVPGTSTTNTVYQLFDMSGTPAMWDLIGMSVLFIPTGPTGYTWVQQTCGIHQEYGSGCYDRTATFYELFAGSAFDLSGQTLTLLPAGGGYFANTAPISTFFTPVGPSLGLTDDSLSSPIALPAVFPYPGASTSSITVCSNGRVFLGGGANATFGVTNTQFLIDGPSIGTFFDFNPSAGGTVVYDFDATNNQAIVTWNGVFAFGTTSPNTWQIVMSLAGSANPGAVELRWQSFSNNSTTNSGAALVGFTSGNGVTDPGSRDISATVPFTTLPELHALAMSAAPAPTMGSPTTWTIRNIPATASFSAFVMNFAGVTPPGVDLGFLGAPGCNQLIALGGASTVLLFGTPTVSQTLTIPSGPSWVGFRVYAQGASFVPGANPLGVITSNGVQTTIF